MALDFFAGCVGGCAGVIVGHPLDTVKVRLQTQDSKHSIYRGTWDCLRTITRQEKVSGLYRGVTSPLGGVAVVNALVFGVYGTAQKTLGTEGLYSHFMSGALAGFVQSFVCSPLELAKVRLQVTDAYRGTFDCLRQTFKTAGVPGVFKGLGLTVSREVPAFGIYFATYELATGGQDVPTWQMMFAGGIAGSSSWLLVYPVDVLKTRMQSDVTGRYRSVLHCLKDGIRTDGYSFLGRGLVSTMVRAFPTNAVTFTVVTWTMRFSELVTSHDPKTLVYDLQKIISGPLAYLEERKLLH